jgi:ribosomal protein S4
MAKSMWQARTIIIAALQIVRINGAKVSIVGFACQPETQKTKRLV